MKLQICMKSPDAIYNAIREANLSMDLDLDENDKIRDLLTKWFKYGEYVYLEVDTETQTCVVLENP